MRVGEENPHEVVDIGDVVYWPRGRPYSYSSARHPSAGLGAEGLQPVNVFGKVKGDPKIFTKVKDGEKTTMKLNEK